MISTQKKRLVFAVAMLLVVALLASFLVATSASSSSPSNSSSSPSDSSDLIMVLNIDSIHGDAHSAASALGPKYDGWLIVTAFNWSMMDVEDREDFCVVLQTSSASPALLHAFLINDVLEKAELDVFEVVNVGRAVNVECLQYDFTKIVLSSYAIAGRTSDSHPLEQYTFNFQTLKMTCWPIDARGHQGSPTSTEILLHPT